MKKLGLDCLDVNGDWGLLGQYLDIGILSQRAIYELGVIPHYVDFDSPIVHSLTDHESTLLIDITDGIDFVLKQISRCKRYISSSLHGIIACESLSIPNWRGIFSDNVVGQDLNSMTTFVRAEEMKPGPSTHFLV